MPNTPNQNNPLCPSCGSTMGRNGHTKHGNQRFRCKCGKSFTPSKKSNGRPPKASPMTNTERQRKYRERKKKIVDT